MAEIDTADPRWRVADMGEAGKNVNAWHWTEHDALAWTRQRLSQLFGGGAVGADDNTTTKPLATTTAAGGGVAVAPTGLRLCKGECMLNNRKGRVIVTYELEIVVGWSAVDGSGSGKRATGSVTIPHLGDEDCDELLEGEVPAGVRAAVDEGGDNDNDAALGEAARAALLSEAGKREVTARLRQLVVELKAGAPLKKEGAGGGGDAATPAANAAACKPAAAAAPKPVAAATAAAAAAAPTSADDTDSLQLEQRFHARASDLWDCFTNEGKLKAFTQADASLPSPPGSPGPFSWFSGGVEGQVLPSSVPGRRLELEWRFKAWREGCVSRVVLDFEEQEEGQGLIVRLKQTGIPVEDAHGNIDQLLLVERGWKERVFGRIRQVFGYGTGGF
jgi:activator of HSP90 ATPase